MATAVSAMAPALGVVDWAMARNLRQTQRRRQRRAAAPPPRSRRCCHRRVPVWDPRRPARPVSNRGRPAQAAAGIRRVRSRVQPPKAALSPAVPAPPAPQRTAPSAGFTLVELMIGMVICVMLVVGIMTGVVAHQAQRRVHGEQILAMSACRNMMETLRSVDIAQLPTFDNFGFDVPGQNGQLVGLVPQAGDADGHSGKVSVTKHTEWTATNQPYVVTTTVDWRGATRGATFSMTTLMGERR